MTVPQMRATVRDAYNGKSWKYKVDRMSDVQVQAVYFSLRERGAFDKKPVEYNKYGEKLEKPLAYEPYVGSQLSIF